MRTFQIMTITGVLYLLTSATCLAEATNFSGQWVLDAASSKMKFAPISSQTLDIKQADPNLEVLETSGNTKTKHTYTTDGVIKKVNVEGILTVEISAKWQGSSLQMCSEAGRSKTLETWQLVDGGKTLQIDRTVSGLIPRQEMLKYRKR